MSNAEAKLHYRSWDFQSFPGVFICKESTYNAGDPGLIPGLGRSRKWPWKSHRQRSLLGFSPWVTSVGHYLVTKLPPWDFQTVPLKYIYIYIYIYMYIYTLDIVNFSYM